MWTIQSFGWGDGEIFILFFVLRESGRAKMRNVLKKCEQYIKCGLSNYLCGGRRKGVWVLFFIFCYFLLFINYLLLLFTFEGGRGREFYFFINCKFFINFFFTLENRGGHGFYFFIFCYFFTICKVFVIYIFTLAGEGGRGFKF